MHMLRIVRIARFFNHVRVTQIAGCKFFGHSKGCCIPDPTKAPLGNCCCQIA